MEAHPAADRWPMLDDKRLQELADSIAADGLRDPIWVDLDGRILDGRNRLAACELAGVTPQFVTFQGRTEPERTAFIWQGNLRRDVSAEERRRQRRLRVAELKAEGMSTRRIAEEIGVPKSTVSRDEDMVSHDGTPRPPDRIVGVDGKTYSRKRESLIPPDQVDEVIAAYDAADTAGKEALAQQFGYASKKSLASAIAARRKRSTPLHLFAVAQQQRIDTIRKLAGTGVRASSIAAQIGITVETVRQLARDNDIVITSDVVVAGRSKVNSTRVVDTAVLQAGSVTETTLAAIRFADLDHDRIPDWIDQLDAAIRNLRKLRKQLSQQKEEPLT